MKTTSGDAIRYKMYVYLDVFGSSMEDQIQREVCGGDVVAIDDQSIGKTYVKFDEKLLNLD